MSLSKFRIWDGKLLYYPTNINEDFDKEGKFLSFALTQNGQIIYISDNGLMGLCAGYEPTYIVQRYTGINDINGKEIYEGDIVSTERVIKKDIVIWEDLGFKIGPFYLGMMGSLRYKLQVIGNILENSDILDEEDEEE